MSEKTLLLSSAKAGVLIAPGKTPSHWPRKIAIALGLLAVVVGGVDMAQRLSHFGLSEKTSLLAFAPAAALDDPAVIATLSATSSATSTPATPLVPARLVVPSLRINAPVESVTTNKAGAMGTPSTFGDVSWYSPGSKPGEAGSAVFAGHINNALTTAGVFEHLSQIQKGAVVQVADKSGRTLSYTVESVEQYAVATAPAADIFASDGPSRIVLITCDGDWDQAAHSFDKRLVVTATLN